jgi:hypothetical protein
MRTFEYGINIISSRKLSFSLIFKSFSYTQLGQLGAHINSTYFKIHLFTYQNDNNVNNGDDKKVASFYKKFFFLFLFSKDYLSME